MANSSFRLRIIKSEVHQNKMINLSNKRSLLVTHINVVACRLVDISGRRRQAAMKSKF